MHELSAAKNIIELVLNELKDKKVNQAKKVKIISLELGGFTGYRSDSVLFYFDEIKKNYALLSDSNLVIKEITTRVKCNDCSRVSEITDPILIYCNQCNSGNVEIIQGKDIILKSIDI